MFVWRFVGMGGIVYVIDFVIIGCDFEWFFFGVDCI